MYRDDKESPMELTTLSPNVGQGLKVGKDRKVEEPLRTYLKPIAAIVENDGISKYPIADIYELPDGGLAFVKWNATKRRYLFEDAHYIVNPDPALTTRTEAGINFLSSDDFNIKTRITLGASLPNDVWSALQDAANGPPKQKTLVQARPV